MNHDLLKEICLVKGISSFESKVVEKLNKVLADGNFDFERDGIGSLIVHQNLEADGLKIMFSSHMDEVGYMVESFEGDFLKLRNIGSFWTHLVVGQLYTLVTKDGKEFTGLIASPATHSMPEEVRAKTLSTDKIYLDLGMTESDMKMSGVSIGDMVVPHAEYLVSANGQNIITKALDDRVSCYLGVELLKKKINTPHKISWAFMVQEEPGLRGARGCTNIIKPDISINLDTTLAGDGPFDRNAVKLGKGVVLSCIDSNSLVHRGLLVWLEDLCEENGIDYQLAVFNRGGTDSGNIHKCLDGVVNITLSIPMRYMHTNYGMVHVYDIQSCLDLLELIVNKIDQKVLEDIKG